MAEPGTRRVALLRGINVGGVGLPMADLRAAAADLGWRDAATYIASGQMVFRAAGTDGDLGHALTAALEARIGAAIPALVLSKDAFDDALAGCPFDPTEGKHVHAFFLWNDTRIDTDLYAALKAPDERLELRGRTAWLHAPAGIGRSKLADKLHRVLPGTDMTARNLNTLRRLRELLDAM
ncbi:DUF1697 domain-containing protein [Wenxinia saemankumensis]|uniref:Uncharacterized conserved protein, DUF1697 family n=1 Tax=Wenxinia saemankumensis TaxID=1447782 RepID=A0A1M5ZZ58_9RHOB|nr:DUF1697 domain-containing protein [Wenxinia saemankumensis]SHI29545.1 Uncharacterized conserved protein, DUF1697 family [Wenxinia saemankumensis]